MELLQHFYFHKFPFSRHPAPCSFYHPLILLDPFPRIIGRGINQQYDINFHDGGMTWKTRATSATIWVLNWNAKVGCKEIGKSSEVEQFTPSDDNFDVEKGAIPVCFFLSWLFLWKEYFWWYPPEILCESSILFVLVSNSYFFLKLSSSFSREWMNLE